MPSRVARTLVALAVAASLAGCAGIRNHRGYIIDPQLVQGIQVGVDNKASVEKTLGRPTFTGQFDPNDWYYVSQDTRQTALGSAETDKLDLLHVKFDAAGNVAQVQTAGKEQIAEVDPKGGKTPTLGSDKSFIEELFGNIGTIAQPGLPGSTEQ